MVRGRMTLWMRSATLVLSAATALMAGCVVESADSIPDPNEVIAEAESLLDESDSPAAPESPSVVDAPIMDPDPDPWRPINMQNSDPTDPDCLKATHTPSPSGGHDEA